MRVGRFFISGFVLISKVIISSRTLGQRKGKLIIL